MKVKDLINILKNIPPDAEVRILDDVSSPMSFEPFYQMKELLPRFAFISANSRALEHSSYIILKVKE